VCLRVHNRRSYVCVMTSSSLRMSIDSRKNGPAGRSGIPTSPAGPGDHLAEYEYPTRDADLGSSKSRDRHRPRFSPTVHKPPNAHFESGWPDGMSLGHAKPHIVVTIRGMVVVTVGGTTIERIVVPGPAAQHTGGGRSVALYRRPYSRATDKSNKFAKRNFFHALAFGEQWVGGGRGKRIEVQGFRDRALATRNPTTL
jgi:hypothetical protein